MRALIVTNMWPSASEPALGSFVRDQVDALRELDGVEIEVFAFPPGGYLRAARALRRYYQNAEEFPADVVELLQYFEPAQGVQAVRAVPGAGADVEVWILGSSLFGAQLAAALGLP